MEHGAWSPDKSELVRLCYFAAQVCEITASLNMEHRVGSKEKRARSMEEITKGLNYE